MNITPKLKTWLVSTALVLLTFTLYWPVHQHAFLNYDDNLYVTQNRHVQAGLTMEGLKWAFQFGDEGRQTYWHPLTWISHMIDCQLFGLNAGAHHIVNVLFHIANTLALFLLLRSMTSAFWPSAIVAAIFAVHPLQVESVAWVAERKNVLSTFFWFMTIAVYARYAARPSVIRYLMVLVLFALGLMAKPMLVTLPCVLLLLDFWPLRRLQLDNVVPMITPTFLMRSAELHRKAARLLIEKLPLFLLSAASSTITVLEHKRLGLVLTGEGYSMASRTAHALVAYIRYIAKIFWPCDLAIFYPLQAGSTTFDIAASALALAGITAISLWVLQKQPYWVVGWFWFLGTLVPVIGIVQVNEQALADRFAYVPLIGILLIMTWSAMLVTLRLPRRRAIVISIVALTLSGEVIRTSAQLRTWKDSETAFAHALTVNANNAPAQVGLALALAEKGDSEEAMLHLNQALRIKPNSPEVLVHIAQLQSQRGEFRKAIASYKTALSYRQDLPEALNNLAWLLSTGPDPELRNGTEAASAAERACSLTGYRDITMIGTLGAAYAESGRFPEAIRSAEMAIQLATNSGDHRLAQRNTALLNLYKQGIPFHETRSR